MGSTNHYAFETSQLKFLMLLMGYIKNCQTLKAIPLLPSKDNRRATLITIHLDSGRKNGRLRWAGTNEEHFDKNTHTMMTTNDKVHRSMACSLLIYPFYDGRFDGLLIYQYRIMKIPSPFRFLFEDNERFVRLLK